MRFKSVTWDARLRITMNSSCETKPPPMAHAEEHSGKSLAGMPIKEGAQRQIDNVTTYFVSRLYDVSDDCQTVLSGGNAAAQYGNAREAWNPPCGTYPRESGPDSSVLRDTERDALSILVLTRPRGVRNRGPRQMNSFSRHSAKVSARLVAHGNSEAILRIAVTLDRT